MCAKLGQKAFVKFAIANAVFYHRVDEYGDVFGSCIKLILALKSGLNFSPNLSYYLLVFSGLNVREFLSFSAVDTLSSFSFLWDNIMFCIINSGYET